MAAPAPPGRSGEVDPADVAVVVVGNHPNGGFDSVWAKVSVPSEGREAVDRQSITLEQEELIKQVFRANAKTIVVLVSSFPYAINWTQANVPAILHMALNSQEEGRALAGRTRTVVASMGPQHHLVPERRAC